MPLNSSSTQEWANVTLELSRLRPAQAGSAHRSSCSLPAYHYSRILLKVSRMHHPIPSLCSLFCSFVSCLFGHKIAVSLNSELLYGQRPHTRGVSKYNKSSSCKQHLTAIMGSFHKRSMRGSVCRLALAPIGKIIYTTWCQCLSSLSWTSIIDQVHHLMPPICGGICMYSLSHRHGELCMFRWIIIGALCEGFVPRQTSRYDTRLTSNRSSLLAFTVADILKYIVLREAFVLRCRDVPSECDVIGWPDRV
jgi:hypothetical protein